MQQVYLKKQNLAWQKVAIHIAVLVFVILFLNFFASPIRNTFLYISRPISSIFLQGGNDVATVFGFFTSNDSLRTQVDQLTRENQSLLSQNVLLQDTISQNQLLKIAQENTRESGEKVLMANVVALHLGFDSINIDKGSADGISENMPVISAQNVVYGKISKVYNNFSEVTLISAPSSVVDVKIQDFSDAPIINGAIKGDGNLGMHLDLVSGDAVIPESATIVTSGLEGIYPRDLLIGSIISSNQNDIKPFQTAKIEPLFDVKNTDTLFVITGYSKLFKK